MPEWVFPNAFAESIRRTARLRGQDANRLVIRDWGEKWPPAKYDPVRANVYCPQAGQVPAWHQPKPPEGVVCGSCGVYIQGG